MVGINPLGNLLGGSLLVAAMLGSGCATTVDPPTERYAKVITPPPKTPESGPILVARYSRYTLVELMPQPAQRDLMQQVVEVVIPFTLDVNVGDAMRHVLLRSGYRLCDSAEASALYALPLPAAHLRLGPLVLRDALLTLAGPAWDLSVDDTTRQVCFQRRAASANSATAPAAPNVDQATADETRKEHP